MTTLSLPAIPNPISRLEQAQPSDASPIWRSFEAVLSSPSTSPPHVWQGIDRKSTPLLAIALTHASGTPHLASLTDSHRQEAIQHILLVGRWAQQEQCSRILLELGPIDHPQVASLNETWAKIAGGTYSGSETRQDLRNLRQQLADRHLDVLCRTLHQLGRTFPGLTWCLGASSTPMGIPNFLEIELILEDLRRSEVHLGYWHRTDLCHQRERLGLESSESWLEQFGRWTAACRLEDTRKDEQGLLPGSGEVDFGPIASLLPKNCLRSVPWPEKASRSDLDESVRFLHDKNLF